MAKSILLEPIMSLEIVVPEQYMGDVISEIHSRRANILEMGTRGVLGSLRVMCPLQKCLGTQRYYDQLHKVGVPLPWNH